MGRPRKYATDAERQRACRARQDATTVRVDRRALERLERHLDELQVAVCRAAGAGDETARACQAGSAETVVEKLIRHFKASAGAKERNAGKSLGDGKGGQRGNER
jgi:hypothetical protein